MSRLLEQRRAAFSLEFVRAHQTSEDAKDLARQIQRTPVRILTNGLGQAVAFLKQKHVDSLVDHLQDWLCGVRDEQHPARMLAGRDLMSALFQASRGDYVAAEEEALNLFSWLKKFGDAYLETGEGK